MNWPVRVGVQFDEPGLTELWIRELTPLLAGTAVVEQLGNAAEIAIVGNPAGQGLRRFPSLRFVQSTWAGVDRLMEDAPEVPVSRMVAPVLVRLMTEFVLASVMALHRGFPSYRRSQVRREWKPGPVVGAEERSVGVLGFGELGAPAARALHTAGFGVTAWARSSRPGEIRVLTGEKGFAEILRSSEILVNLLPLTAATRGILDRTAFALMPHGASLVNVGRGDHVVERDLLIALDGHLGDAVLDVFSQEPLPADNPLWEHPRVLVLPHVAAPSDPRELAPLVAENIRRFLSGEGPRFLVER